MPLPEPYQRLTEHGGWFDRSDRSRLEITGPDRAKFLHNLVTSDVKRMAEGSGSEAFVTSPQGKTLAYITILATDRAILLRTEPESLEGMLPHLRKYGVFDDVAIDDVSAKTFEIHVTHPWDPKLVAEQGIDPDPMKPLEHIVFKAKGIEVRHVVESPTGRPGYTLIGPLEALDAVKSQLDEEGKVEVDGSVFEVLRIEAGTPVSGRDVTPNHLPQEVGRDAQAINFVKGCYLGQETVARLDALGHVNKILKGLKVEGSVVPPPGASLMLDGKAVGTVTSSAWSPGWVAPVALAYVRVAQAEPGTRLSLTFDGGEAQAIVADLPMLPPLDS
jgi:folate-binding protein YgfZ